MHRHHHQNPQRITKRLQERHQRTRTRRLLLQYSDALVLERLRELNELGALRIDGQRGDNQIGPLVDHLANQSGPLLFRCVGTQRGAGNAAQRRRRR